jgi:hypothetical protein
VGGMVVVALKMKPVSAMPFVTALSSVVEERINFTLREDKEIGAALV